MKISPFLIFLITEITKIAIAKVEEQGKLGTLTEEEAKAMIVDITDTLSVNLPTPEELESGNVA